MNAAEANNRLLRLSGARVAPTFVLKYNIRTRSLTDPGAIEDVLAVENDVVPFDRADVLEQGCVNAFLGDSPRSHRPCDLLGWPTDFETESDARISEWLTVTVPACLRSNTPILGISVTVVDFWCWAYSDFRGNTARPLLAEYLVGNALGAIDRPGVPTRLL